MNNLVNDIKKPDFQHRETNMDVSSKNPVLFVWIQSFIWIHDFSISSKLKTSQCLSSGQWINNEVNLSLHWNTTQ
jgi:hypothetical protein